MKKLAITIAAVFATLNIFAQGTVNFSNQGIVGATVYDDTKPVALTKAVGGTTFSVALYWAPVDAANPNVQPAASAFTAQTPSGHVGIPLPPPLTGFIPGLYSVGTVTIAGITPAGGMGWFQVKAWETAYGNTFEEAYAAVGARVGMSGVIKIATGNPVPPPTPAAVLTGIGAIHLILVPEPAILGLGLLGGAALLLLRRRK